MTTPKSAIISSKALHLSKISQLSLPIISLKSWSGYMRFNSRKVDMVYDGTGM